MATCTPARTASPISPATRWTTSGARPIPPPPKVSPDSFSSTRRALGRSLTDPPGPSRWRWGRCAGGPGPEGPGPPLGSGSHAEASEARHRAAGLGEHLADRLLVVLRERLVEQHVLLEEARHAALDDLGQSSFGLALVARGLLGDVPLGGDRLGGDILA